MEKWVVMAKKADFQEIGRTFGIDPVIARLIRNRDVEGMDNIRSYPVSYTHLDVYKRQL